MSLEPKIKARIRRLQVLERLSADEIAWALREVQRLSTLEWPTADPTVAPIDCTGGQWYRQRPDKAPFRTILSIQRDTHQIVVEAVLRRDKTTYERVEIIFNRSRGR